MASLNPVISQPWHLRTLRSPNPDIPEPWLSNGFLLVQPPLIIPSPLRLFCFEALACPICFTPTLRIFLISLFSVNEQLEKAFELAQEVEALFTNFDATVYTIIFIPADADGVLPPGAEKYLKQVLLQNCAISMNTLFFSNIV